MNKIIRILLHVPIIGLLLLFGMAGRLSNEEAKQMGNMILASVIQFISVIGLMFIMLVTTYG